MTKGFRLFSLLVISAMYACLPMTAQAQTPLTTVDSTATAPAEISPPPTPIPEPKANFYLTVSPPIIDLRVDAGASASGSFRVKNNSDANEHLILEFGKFVAGPDASRPVFSDLDATDIFPEWFNLSQKEFDAAPHQWNVINYTFKPPLTANPAYYIAVTARRASDVKLHQVGEAARGSEAILFLIQVNSSRVYHAIDLQQLGGKSIGFTTDHYIYEFLPVNFSVRIANNGNVHETAFGNIYIDWLTGHKLDIGVLDVNKEGSIILPQTNRNFSSTWNEGFPRWEPVLDSSGNQLMDKIGKPVRHLTWDFSKILWFRIGKYRAHLVLAYNDGVRDIPLEAETEFWVIPWRILLALLVLLLIIGFGLKNVIQSIIKKFKEAAQYARYQRRRTPPIPTKKL